MKVENQYADFLNSKIQKTARVAFPKKPELLGPTSTPVSSLIPLMPPRRAHF